MKPVFNLQLALVKQQEDPSLTPRGNTPIEVAVQAIRAGSLPLLQSCLENGTVQATDLFQGLPLLSWVAKTAMDKTSIDVAILTEMAKSLFDKGANTVYLWHSGATFGGRTSSRSFIRTPTNPQSFLDKFALALKVLPDGIQVQLPASYQLIQQAFTARAGNVLSHLNRFSLSWMSDPERGRGLFADLLTWHSKLSESQSSTRGDLERVFEQMVKASPALWHSQIKGVGEEGESVASYLFGMGDGAQSLWQAYNALSTPNQAVQALLKAGKSQPDWRVSYEARLSPAHLAALFPMRYRYEELVGTVGFDFMIDTCAEYDVTPSKLHEAALRYIEERDRDLPLTPFVRQRADQAVELGDLGLFLSCFVLEPWVVRQELVKKASLSPRSIQSGLFALLLALTARGDRIDFSATSEVQTQVMGLAQSWLQRVPPVAPEPLPPLTKSKISPTFLAALRAEPFDEEALLATIEPHMVDGVDERGESPLHLLLSAPSPSMRCIEKALACGANPLLRNQAGVCPLEQAPHLSKLFLLTIGLQRAFQESVAGKMSRQDYIRQQIPGAA